MVEDDEKEDDKLHDVEMDFSAAKNEVRKPVPTVSVVRPRKHETNEVDDDDDDECMVTSGQKFVQKPGFFNRQIITLLSALGVKDDIFWDMQIKNVMNLKQMLVNNDVAYNSRTFILTYVRSSNPHHEYIRLYPKGFKFRKKMFEEIDRLVAFFQKHINDPQDAGPSIRSVAAMVPMRSPATGGSGGWDGSSSNDYRGSSKDTKKKTGVPSNGFNEELFLGKEAKRNDTVSMNSVKDMLGKKENDGQTACGAQLSGNSPLNASSTTTIGYSKDTKKKRGVPSTGFNEELFLGKKAKRNDTVSMNSVKDMLGKKENVDDFKTLSIWISHEVFSEWNYFLLGFYSSRQEMYRGLDSFSTGYSKDTKKKRGVPSTGFNKELFLGKEAKRNDTVRYSKDTKKKKSVPSTGVNEELFLRKEAKRNDTDGQTACGAQLSGNSPLNSSSSTTTGNGYSKDTKKKRGVPSTGFNEELFLGKEAKRNDIHARSCYLVCGLLPCAPIYMDMRQKHGNEFTNGGLNEFKKQTGDILNNVEILATFDALDNVFDGYGPGSDAPSVGAPLASSYSRVTGLYLDVF
nr:transcription elongation factor SPT6 homolog [Tanacetum cinerariifolium]